MQIAHVFWPYAGRSPVPQGGLNDGQSMRPGRSTTLLHENGRHGVVYDATG